MAEYERSRLVLASPEDVFAFVSDPKNLATFLPTVDTVEPQEEGRVEVHGEIRGRTYEDEGGSTSMRPGIALSGAQTSGPTRGG